MPENALLAEGNAALRFQIGVYARLRGDAIVQRDDPGKVPFEPRHRSRKGVAQAGNKLK